MNIGLVGLIVGLVGVLIAIAGVWYAVYARRNPLSRARLAYQTSKLRYFEEGDYALPADAAMTFKGQPVTRLYKVTIVLWNAGSAVLHGKDIVDSEPIRVSVLDGRVLSHGVTRVTTEVNNAELHPIADMTDEVAVSYDYLNPGDGLVLQVMHSGSGSTMRGTAKGLPKGPEDWGTIVSVEKPKQAWYASHSATMLLVTLGLSMTFAFYWIRSGSPMGSDASPIILGLVLGLVAAIVRDLVVARWRTRRRHPKSLTPISTETNDQDDMVS